MCPYAPPYTVSAEAICLVAEICTRFGSIGTYGTPMPPRLRRENNIRSVHSSLAIENNSLSFDEATDVIEGKRVLGDPDDILEVKNAFECYGMLSDIDPRSMSDLLKVHDITIRGLQPDAGQLRRSRVGVSSGRAVIHQAPPPELVPGLLSDLLKWLATSQDHPLIKGCVFHHEFERIHPFTDGNGRTGRLWHTAILAKWHEEFAWVPVESVVRRRQDEYYRAIAVSNERHDSGPFVDFMLGSILTAIDDVLVPNIGA